MKFHDEKTDRLGRFLRENRPQPPAASHDDLERMWEKVQGEGEKKRFSGRAALMAAATAALCVWGILRWPDSEPAWQPGAAMEEAALASELMKLDFIEGEDIREVGELVSLAD